MVNMPGTHDVWGKSREEQRRLRREQAVQNKLKYASRFLPRGFLADGEKILLAQGSFFGNTAYIITSKRIIKREGFIRKKYAECPLDKIKSVRMDHPSGNKNFGNIEFVLKEGQIKSLSWKHVKNSEAVYKIALSVIQREEGVR